MKKHFKFLGNMGKIIAILLLVIPLIINIIVIFWLPQIFAVKKFGIIDKIYDILIGNRYNLKDFGNFVITCSAVTAAVVILCYSVLDSKKLGVSMRGVIRNWMGGIFLPEIFMLMLIKLPFLKLWAYSHQDYILFIGCILSLIEQAVMVVFVLISNSMHAVVYTIINEEYKRYKQAFYMEDGDKAALYVNVHITQAFESDSFFEDKVWLLKGTLQSPIKHINKIHIEISERQQSVFFSYYYENAYGTFQSVEKNKLERFKLFDFYYKFVKEHLNIFNEGGMEEEWYELGAIAVAAILHAAIVSEIEDSVDFCEHILVGLYSKYDNRERQEIQIFYFFLSLEILLFTTKNSKKIAKDIYQSKIIDYLCDHTPDFNVESHFYALYKFWRLVMSEYTIEEYTSVKVYLASYNSLMGLSYKSPMLRYIYDKRRT